MKSHNTYPINEEQLKQALHGYEVEYCEKQWEILEAEIANIKSQKNQAFKNFSAKLLVIPAAAIVLIVVLYFSLSNVFSKNTNETIQPVTNTVQETIQHEPIPEPPPPAKKVVDNSATVAAEKAKLIADSLAIETKKGIESKIKVVATDSNSVTEKKSDDTSKIATEPALNDQKSDVVKKKKKRKKKKNSFESIESLRKNSLVPNDADNDVVVPN